MDKISISFDQKSLNIVLESLGTMVDRINQLTNDIVTQVNDEVKRRQETHNELELPESPNTEVQ